MKKSKESKAPVTPTTQSQGFIPQRTTSFQQHQERIAKLIAEGMHDGNAWKPEAFARYREIEDLQLAAELAMRDSDALPRNFDEWWADAFFDKSTSKKMIAEIAYFAGMGVVEAGVTPTPPTDPQSMLSEFCKVVANHPLEGRDAGIAQAFFEIGWDRALAAPGSTSGPRYDWKCLSCQSQVSTVCDFHINSRPLCNLCNGEMIPFVGEPLTEDDLKRIENSVLRAKVGGDEVEGGATPQPTRETLQAIRKECVNGFCGARQWLDHGGAAPLMEQSQSARNEQLS